MSTAIVGEGTPNVRDDPHLYRHFLRTVTKQWPRGIIGEEDKKDAHRCFDACAIDLADPLLIFRCSQPFYKFLAEFEYCYISLDQNRLTEIEERLTQHLSGHSHSQSSVFDNRWSYFCYHFLFALPYTWWEQHSTYASGLHIVLDLLRCVDVSLSPEIWSFAIVEHLAESMLKQKENHWWASSTPFVTYEEFRSALRKQKQFMLDNTKRPNPKDLIDYKSQFAWKWFIEKHVQNDHNFR